LCHWTSTVPTFRHWQSDLVSGSIKLKFLDSWYLNILCNSALSSPSTWCFNLARHICASDVSIQHCSLSSRRFKSDHHGM
jgi:hypothetical protein